MKKAIFLIVFLITIIISAIIFINFFINKQEPDITSQLTGKIYYLKRDGETLNLYSAKANFEDKKLLYAHQGEENNNILDFYFDEESKLIYFVAMKNGQWSQFSISEKDLTPNYIKTFDKGENWKIFLKHYIQPEHDSMKLVNKKGSLYLVKNGEEQLLKKFIGFYDAKFNSGYVPIGFSPDGKYIIYHSSEHFTPIGTLIEGLLDQDYDMGQTYIMNLETKKFQKYPSFHTLQWVTEKQKSS